MTSASDTAGLAFRSASELAAGIRARTIGSLELLDCYLERIDRLNGPINAVVTLDAERARAEAKHLDDRAARGDFAGPLHGLPMTVKDCIETAGMRTTSGAPDLSGHVPGRDADAVARLRAAGAVIFGKTNLPLYAGDLQTFNDVFGTTNNPWDATRTPGGSSGGAAAAVAAGLTSLELGSDLAGSIRLPAHFCGVYGHKPSYGIVPLRGHVPPAPGTLARDDIAVLGPLARSAGDLALALDVIAGPDAADAAAWRLALPPPRQASLRDYRVAAWFDDPAAPIDDAVHGRLDAAVDALRAAGVRVDIDARPAISMDVNWRTFVHLLLGVTAGGLPPSVFDALADAASRIPPEDESDTALWMRAATQRKIAWDAANEEAARMRARWAEFFTSYDVILCPAHPTLAFPHDHIPQLLARQLTVNGAPQSYIRQTMWSGLAGVGYLPVSVAPVGRAQGLPVGVQIIAPFLEDRTAIDFAMRLADVIGGYEPPPAFE